MDVPHFTCPARNEPCEVCVMNKIQPPYKRHNVLYVGGRDPNAHMHIEYHKIFFENVPLNPGVVGFTVKYMRNKAAKKIQRWYRRLRFINSLVIAGRILLEGKKGWIRDLHYSM